MGGILKKMNWTEKILSEKHCEQCSHYDSKVCPSIKLPKSKWVVCPQFKFDFEFDEKLEKSLIREKKTGA